MGAVAAFWGYYGPLETVYSFKYLGYLLTATDDYWTAVIANLWNSRKVCFFLYRVLWRKDADSQISGRFYIIVVQAVLLFRSETWVLISQIKRLLGGSTIRWYGGYWGRCLEYRRRGRGSTLIWGG